jgi:hypothetical protein
MSEKTGDMPDVEISLDLSVKLRAIGIASVAQLAEKCGEIIWTPDEGAEISRILRAAGRDAVLVSIESPEKRVEMGSVGGDVQLPRLAEIARLNAKAACDMAAALASLGKVLESLESRELPDDPGQSH